MKNLFFVFFSLLVVTLHAQTNKDTLQPLKFQSGFWVQNGVRISRLYAFEQMKKNSPQALDLFQRGRANKTVGNIFGGVSGFLVGYTLGAGIKGQKATNNYLIGAGGLLINIIFDQVGNSKYRQAAALFNQSIEPKKTGMHLAPSQQGVGIALHF